MVIRRSTSRFPFRRMHVALLTGALVLIAALGAASALYSNRHINHQQTRIGALHRDVADAQRLQLLIAESQASIRQWLISGRMEHRDASVRSADLLREAGRELAGRLEPSLRAHALPPVGASLEHLLRTREQAHAMFDEDGAEAARQILLRAGGTETARRMREVLDHLRDVVEAELKERDQHLRSGQLVGLLLIGGSSLAMLTMLLVSILLVARRHAAAEAARSEMDRRGRDVAALFSMGELLQSSLSSDDIRRVVAHTVEELLPEVEGAFYVFNNSRDRLDLLGAWGHAGVPPVVPAHFGPNECWALKRGRPHDSSPGRALRCDHAAGTSRACLCMPMQARGEVYGVLQFLTFDEPLAAGQAELAHALGDGVSLALSNLALREKLRNQALRDDLTGLYNRRFLEETLPRLVAHAERRSASVAVLMLDLDHFKQVNDRYGHAVGDAVLREVGALLLARLRRMDVACRYGGEELTVLMPDCSAQDALLRAEEICALVRNLRERADSTLPAVTISIGVAAWPEHGEQIGRVMEAADAALYEAKRQGRDRAMPAEATAPALPLPVGADRRQD